MGVSAKQHANTPEGLQGYLAHKKQAPPQDPTVGLCLGPFDGPRGVGVSYELGTPVGVGGECLGAGVHAVASSPRLSKSAKQHANTPAPLQGYLAHKKQRYRGTSLIRNSHPLGPP